MYGRVVSTSIYVCMLAKKCDCGIRGRSYRSDKSTRDSFQFETWFLLLCVLTKYNQNSDHKSTDCS